MNFNSYPNAYQTSPYVNPYANKLATYDQMAQNIANNPYNPQMGGMPQQGMPQMGGMPQQGMQPNMNMPQQGMSMPTPQSNGIKMVTSIEETKNVTPNFDGTEIYFKDTVNKKLYVKYINLNGLPQTDVYKFETQTEVKPTTYVTQEDFDSLREQVESLTKSPTATNKRNSKTVDKGENE